MEMIRDGGKTVVCPECYAHLHVPEPVTEGQEILCHQCRVVVVIKMVEGQLTPVARKDEQADEDTTW
jgi:transcription initiation factor TFIIIB Brf1 subunit/transcription initiation factor TFIIB